MPTNHKPASTEQHKRQVTKATQSTTERLEHTRIETRWPITARELDDLAELAMKLPVGNPNRRGEAVAYIINMWSRVVHGELSPGAFWEFFGVSLPAPQPPSYPGYPYPMMGMFPAMPGYDQAAMQPQAPPQTQNDSEATAHKRKRAENSKAFVDDFTM
jgi:hypothetical protein